MTTTPTGRAAPRHYICGACGNATRTKNPTANHRRCHGPCACGEVRHRFGPDLAKSMAAISRVDLDTVYTAHGRKRRVLTPDQRQAAVARLAEWRERRVS